MKAFIQTSILMNLGLYAVGHVIPAFAEFASTGAWAMLVVGYAVLTLRLAAFIGFLLPWAYLVLLQRTLFYS